MITDIGWVLTARRAARTITKSSITLEKTSTALAKIAGVSSGSMHLAHGLPLAGAEVGGGLLVLPAERASRAWTMIAGQLTFHVTSDSTCAIVPRSNEAEQHREREEHRDAEDQLGNDVRQDHHEVERRRRVALPPVDAERERHAERHRDQGGVDRQPHGLDDGTVQGGVVQHRVDRIAEVPAPGEALPDALRFPVVEREEDRDHDRHQRPDQVQPGEALKEPRVAPGVAPQPAGQRARGVSVGPTGGRARCRSSRYLPARLRHCASLARLRHDASLDARLVATT